MWGRFCNPESFRSGTCCVGGYPQHDATISVIEPRAAWDGINHTCAIYTNKQIRYGLKVIDWLHRLSFVATDHHPLLMHA